MLLKAKRFRVGNSYLWRLNERLYNPNWMDNLVQPSKKLRKMRDRIPPKIRMTKKSSYKTVDPHPTINSYYARKGGLNLRDVKDKNVPRHRKNNRRIDFPL